MRKKHDQFIKRAMEKKKDEDGNEDDEGLIDGQKGYWTEQ